ncbi:endothelial protein C receptor [Rhineura floridana]|uniref:endothelial protein C receptor n=1 Tax=Rhineura floridana TaxID=261503 RepID=UPI002AC814F1|nr:endothelial protein C receptor [Rhineura floridana]
MLLLQILLISALCQWAYGTGSHAFIMIQLAFFQNSSSVEFVGNATLDGKLTHSMEVQNGQLNASQLLPLEPLYLWEQRKSSLQQYLKQFETLVNMYARERNVPYPLHIYCTLGCQIFKNGTNGTFYEVLLNGTDFLRLHAANHSWRPLQDTPVASFASKELNKYPQTNINPAFFLQETCINFVREHTEVKGASTGKHEGRSHTPLVVGISLGSLALMALAVCIFLCTGGKR